ncbi:MAG TPA: long-chain fatty acid--CoA ligase [Chitinophagaceae bacterium]|nr:long-chain fatty acid--CoA ligase [Chitinophagaceae bacterium]
MTEPTRLFDCIEWQLQKGNNYTMMASKENNRWKEYSVQEVSDIVNQLSAGLLQMGLGKKDSTPEGRDKIALISKNRPEWLMLDMAVQQIGAVLTPFYPTISDPELEYVLNDAAVKIIFVNDASLVEKINNVRANTPLLQHIISFERTEHVTYWKEILSADPQKIDEVRSIAATMQYEDMATIIYTSGTTGKPKGVMLSHKNILSNVFNSMPCFPPGDNLKALSFLPLNHIFERMLDYLYLYKRTSVFFAESMDTIADNLREVKPNLFATVPRVLEKVYERIMQKGQELTGIRRRLFFWAHNLAEKFEINKKQGWLYNIQLSLANKIIFSKWREAIGNNIVCIVSGGAACQVRLIRIFTAAKIPVMEGYGLTETSPVISVNPYNAKERMFGTVGPIIQNVQVKIADDGEILCKGDNIMMGYYKQPDLTAECMEDGWFRTGDIGIMINNKFLKITDRKKEMFKTSGGKYVAPLVIESKLKESLYIENLMVTGAEEKFVGALIVPAFNHLREWMRQQNIPDNGNDAIIQNEKVKEFYKDIVEKYNQQFSHVEQIKRFELLPRDWSVDTGELTPKLSLKRKVIMEKYKDAIRRIYS